MFLYISSEIAMTKFSNELIRKTIKYYADKHDEYINDETAQEYLESMASLYVSMSSFATFK